MSTDSCFEQFYKTISSYIEISNEEWLYYSSMLQLSNVKSKSIILREGDFCRNVFFVNSGLLRVYFTNHEGEEKTFHFALENSFIADYESFLKKIPSCYSIQAAEDTQVVLMSVEMLHAGYQKLRYGEKLGRLLAEDYFFMFSDKIKSIYTQTPFERYNNLTANFPNIFQRVPQHYIASFLNITPVHLSRLKNAEK